MEPKEKHLTVKEVADQLEISPRTVIRYIKNNQLRAIKNRLHKGQGGQWFITQKDLDQFINTLRSLEPGVHSERN